MIELRNTGKNVLWQSQFSRTPNRHGRGRGGDAGGGRVVERALVEEPGAAPRVGLRAPRHGQAGRALQHHHHQQQQQQHHHHHHQLTLLSCSYNWPQPLAATGTSVSSVSRAEIKHFRKTMKQWMHVYLEDRSETPSPCEWSQKICSSRSARCHSGLFCSSRRGNSIITPDIVLL